VTARPHHGTVAQQMEALDHLAPHAHHAALAHHAAAPAFNSTFYATVATVIPVLFLAIALQGGTYQTLLAAYAANVRAYRQTMRAARAAGQLTLRKALASVPSTHLPGYAAAATVLAGLYGEGVALDALYSQQAPPAAGLGVLIATLYLVAIAASGPIGQYQRMVSQDRARREQEARVTHHPAEAQATAGEQSAPAEPGAAMQPGTGETGTAP
jgi:hypothetical protein